MLASRPKSLLKSTVTGSTRWVSSHPRRRLSEDTCSRCHRSQYGCCDGRCLVAAQLDEVVDSGNFGEARIQAKSPLFAQVANLDVWSAAFLCCPLLPFQT